MRLSNVRFVMGIAALWLSQVFSQALPLSQPQSSENVDFTSFSNTLLLKYSIPGEFRKLPKNPLLQPSPADWDSEDVSDPYILQTADSLVLYYSGSSTKSEKYSIGYAVRDDRGWFWKKRGQVVKGSGADWDSYHQVSPVVFNSRESLQMVYFGNREDIELGYSIGAAFSGNGRDWQYPTAVPLVSATNGDWDASGQVYGDVVYLPATGEYRMYYTGFQGPLTSIGLATSRDGREWSRVGSQPVFSNLPGVIAPDVVFNGESYEMYFVQAMIGEKGMATKICRVRSADGLTWGAIEDILQPTDRWEKGTLMRPHLAYFEGRMQLYYCAGNGRWQIGAATATPQFASNGVWRSPAIPATSRELEISYEQPEGTEVVVFLQVAEPFEQMQLAISEVRPTARYNVKRAKMTLPNSAGERRLVIALLTNNTEVSPVVYGLRLQ